MEEWELKYIKVTLHQSLKETDSEIGYKNDGWMIKRFKVAGLALHSVTFMPANNLAFIVEKHQ